MAFDPTMADALSGVSAGVFYALEVTLPSYTLRLCDGAGTVAFGDASFPGKDATFGVLAAIEAVGDGLDNQAPALRFVLNPPSASAASALSSPLFQGSPVKLWIGAFDPASGDVVGEPYLLFLGELDVPTLQAAQGSRSVTFDCVSAFERFFDDTEGARLTNAFHQLVWPGETGLEFVVDVQVTLPWMTDLPRPVLVRDTPR